ncbi:MAG: FAD-dependent oxidoreductase [Chloroflexi bacterium]|nr:FAD-dependent oxidoreductase [Chloroflexota bacterium]
MVAGALVSGGVAAFVRRRVTAGTSARTRHRSETLFAYHAARHKILILGAGFGGMAAALRLDEQLGNRGDTSVLVVDRDSALLFTPLLWTVADGRADPNDVVVPIRAFQRGRSFHLLHANVEGIDLDRREVRTSAGIRAYDYLVVALGSVTAVPSLPGLRERALRFHTPADAIELRNHLIDALENAHHTVDARERREWLTFVVGGGGDTGVELAATIRDYLQVGLLAEYPWLVDERPRVVVVGRAQRLVPMSSPTTSSAVERILRDEGVEVWTDVAIEGVTERAIQTSRGTIPARTLFWAAGITAPPVVRDLPVEHARNGAVLVDETLRVPERPEVFVVGDSAWAFDGVSGEPAPPTAQAAGHMGEYVAEAIAGLIAGQQPTPFRFVTRGRLALLGHRTGVAEVFGHAFQGLPAWLLWHGYYLSAIPAWRNRIRLLTSWLLAGLTGRVTAQLRLGSSTGAEEISEAREPSQVAS